MSHPKTCRLCGNEFLSDTAPIPQDDRMEESLANLCPRCLIDEQYRISKIIVEARLSLLGRRDKSEPR